MTPETGGPEKADGSPTRAGYLIGAVMAVLIVAGIYFALTAGGSAEPGNAHLATPSSGSTNGVQPDERVGTEVKVSTIGLKEAADKAGCQVRADLPNEGSDHLTRDDPVPDYKTSPPTSGDHIGPPLQQADGAYTGTPRPQDVVHSLEHGRIAIQYDPELPESDQLELKGLYDSAYSGALLYPNPDMPYAVAASAWTNLIGCREYRGAETLAAISAFGAQNFDKASEPMSLFPPLEGPNLTNLQNP